jgi:hypothetical protein
MYLREKEVEFLGAVNIAYTFALPDAAFRSCWFAASSSAVFQGEMLLDGYDTRDRFSSSNSVVSTSLKNVSSVSICLYFM